MQKNYSRNQTNKYRNSKYNWRTIFFANSGGFSSKRVLGVLGYITCIILLVVAFIFEKDIPQFADMVLIASTSLVGVDAFKNIFTRNSNI